jgi:hypothetical protein
MAMTLKGTLPAASVDLLPDDADQVHVHAGSEAEPTVVAVAGRTHFRVLDADRLVLYHRGEYIPPEHAELPIRSASWRAAPGCPRASSGKRPRCQPRTPGSRPRRTRTWPAASGMVGP